MIEGEGWVCPSCGKEILHSEPAVHVCEKTDQQQILERLDLLIELLTETMKDYAAFRRVGT